MDKLMNLSHDQGPARFAQRRDGIVIKGAAAIQDAYERATLLDIIESVCEIRATDELHRWSGTDLQRILPHKIVVYGLADFSGQQLKLTPILLAGVSARAQPTDLIASSMNAIAAILACSANEPAPQLITVGDEIPDAADNVREFLGDVATHGVLFDSTGSGTFVAVCQMLEQPDMRHAHALKLLAPHLHIVLKRICAWKKPSTSDIAAPQVQLSARETEVLRWIRQGKSNPEIAQILGRSPHTIKIQVSNILSKLGASNRVHAASRALQLML